MTDRQGRILVIRGGAIGDFILTLPVFAALRSAFPTTEITVLGYPQIAELAVAGGLADAACAIEGRDLSLFFSATAGPHLPLEQAAFFAGFDLILSYLYDPDHIFEANVRRSSKAQYLAGPHRPGPNSGQHATELFLEPLQRLAIFDADPVPRLKLLRQAESPAAIEGNGHRQPRANGWLGAHPGSGSERKNWPEDRWARLLPPLAESTPANLLLVGGEAEEGRLERLAERWPRQRLRIVQNEPLVRLAEQLADCTAFVGHDSGITHLAAALGLPVLALWGDTDAAVWSPRGRQTRIIRHQDGLQELAEEEVLIALLDLMSAGEDSQ